MFRLTFCGVCVCVCLSVCVCVHFCVLCSIVWCNAYSEGY